jgi:assimilatory nitrate reductase catalytic subunit
MDFSNSEDVDLVQRFWQAPRIARAAGLKAVDMFQAIGSGKIKAVWIMGTNPVVSLPDADRVRDALLGCEMVVVSDCIAHTDTTACADILLPAKGWGEKDGTVTNSERRISRQRAFMPAAGEAQADWWIITQVAQRMGFVEAFAYENPAQIFREHAQLSGFENTGQRAFDISALADLSPTQYDELQPAQWPINAQAKHGTQRLFENGQFFSPSGKARMIAVTPQLPSTAPDAEFPLVLNTGRIRDQWHTMTRTGKVPRLNAQVFETFVQIHPADAQLYELQDGGLAQLSSRHGTMLARIQVNEDQRLGSVFVPMHWNDVFAKSARVDALVAPITDPISGQPESKHTPVRVATYQPAWQGFVLSRSRLDFSDTSYCACSEGKGFWRHEIAGNVLPTSWQAWARNSSSNAGDWTEYRDAAMGRYRAACIKEGQLETVFFIAPDQRLPAREWLGSLFSQPQLSANDLAGLLAACPPRGLVSDCGKNVCACFSVGEKTILNAIHLQGLDNVDAIGAALKAGTGCGSCISEIRRLIQREI